MNLISSWIAGFIFGIGLIISGMTDPAKVLGFLDLAGTWNPSLALVMLGAIAVGSLAFAIAKRKTTTFLGLPIQLPPSRHIDGRLIGGNILFGIGWGLAGICPGPALVMAGSGSSKGLLFAGSMIVGMAVFEVIEHLKKKRAAHA
jgi:uncharacterized membrane protein YedE/YeeE